MDIKKEIVEYFKFSDIEIEEYFNSMSDDYLLSRERHFRGNENYDRCNFMIITLL